MYIIMPSVTQIVVVCTSSGGRGGYNKFGGGKCDLGCNSGQLISYWF